MPFAQTTQPGRKRPDLKESFNFAYPFTPGAPRRGVRVTRWSARTSGRGRAAVARGSLEDYYREVFELGQRILERASPSRSTCPATSSAAATASPLVRARLLHYPPQPQSADDGQFGAAEHTDYGTITILWQDDVGGLQVKNRAGEWIDAPYIEDTFVINIGDMLARWSNDLFVSTPHRVVNASGRERYSIPVFYDPDYDIEGRVPAELRVAGQPAALSAHRRGRLHHSRATTAPIRIGSRQKPGRCVNPPAGAWVRRRFLIR